jgi:hypothetical protein
MGAEAEAYLGPRRALWPGQGGNRVARSLTRVLAATRAGSMDPQSTAMMRRKFIREGARETLGACICICSSASPRCRCQRNSLPCMRAIPLTSRVGVKRAEQAQGTGLPLRLGNGIQASAVLGDADAPTGELCLSRTGLQGVD